MSVDWLTGGTNSVERASIPAELQSKTVKEALEMFEKKLEDQVNKFQEQTRQVARSDRAIYRIIALLQQLDQEIRAVETSRKTLTQSVESLLIEQQEFLKNLPEDADDHPAPQDQREHLYYLAHDLGVQLIGMEKELIEIAERTESISSKAETGAAKIEKISNCHLDAMRWLDTQGSLLDDRLNAISKRLKSLT